MSNVIKPKVACVVPTIRPEMMEDFKKDWEHIFIKHDVTLVTVWDGEFPKMSIKYYSPYYPSVETESPQVPANSYITPEQEHLFCRHTDAVRNYGFVYCARLGFTHVLTLDDDVRPTVSSVDPIERHLHTLSLRVPISWMNTSDDMRWCGSPGDPENPYYLRGFPYHIRDEAPVMLSHGVWTFVPDFDGETQLRLESHPMGPPRVLPYHVGPIPKGVYFPLCGMNVMVRAEALPFFYFAPMGPDSGFPDIHRFGDIFMGITLKQSFDKLGWACYTGASVVEHIRASDAKKNMEQEKLGREINEREIWKNPPMHPYVQTYNRKRWEYHDMLKAIIAPSLSPPSLPLATKENSDVLSSSSQGQPVIEFPHEVGGEG